MTRTPTIPRIDLPPSIDQREVRELAKQCGDLRERHRVESQNLVELGHAKDRAVEQDRQAHADAIRGGKADPGARAAEQAERDLVEKRRQVEALEQAVRCRVESEEAARGMASQIQPPPDNSANIDSVEVGEVVANA